MTQQRPQAGTKREKRWSRGRSSHLRSTVRRYFAGARPKALGRRQRRRVEERAWRQEEQG